MGVKTFFQKLFNIDPDKNSPRGSSAKFLNGGSTEFSRYTGELYANHLVRGIVHKIASYCSQISFDHVRGSGDSFELLDDSISRLLNFKPNLYMAPSDLIYKFITDLFCSNNAYMWLKRSRITGEVVSILPVICDRTEMLEIDGFLFYKFHFSSGDKLVVHEADIVHRRRFFYKNDWFGDSNDALREPVGLTETMQVSMDAALKNGAQIKGILQHQNTISPEDLEAHERLFRESYLKASNHGGIGMIDAKFNFIPIAYNGKIVDTEQMKEIRDYVYRQFNMNDDIMMSSYTSDKWQSFHEGTIAPELNGLVQSLRIKLFSERQIGLGHRIIPSINHISFMSPQQKIQMVKLALDGALYTRNEIRQWFGDAPIPGGDSYQFSKNFAETNPETPKSKEEEDNNEQQTDTTDPTA